MKWGPRFSLVGMAGGVLAGLGLLVLLQQAGKVYPTVTVALVVLLGGLVFGIALPSLGILVSVHRTNKRSTAAAAREAARPAPVAAQRPAGGATGTA